MFTIYSDPYTFPIQNLNSLSEQFSIPPSLIQNELIELQAETSIKSKSIIDLWKNYSNYFNLQMIAARILLFSFSTYCCESIFSALQNITNKKRNQLLDENLNSAIICALSCCDPRYLEIVKSTETHISN